MPLSELKERISDRLFSRKTMHVKKHSVSGEFTDTLRTTKQVPAERRIQTGSMLASSGRFSEAKGPMAATLEFSKSNIELGGSFLTATQQTQQ